MSRPSNKKFERQLTERDLADQAKIQLPIIAALKETLDENDVDALLEIGARYLTLKDAQNAEVYFTKAANLGSREAMTFLSKLPILPQQIMFWLGRAADLGDPDSMLAIARYSTQTNLPQLQFEKAKHFYERLLARGDLEVLQEYVYFLVKIGDSSSLLKLDEYIRKTSIKIQQEIAIAILRMHNSSREILEMSVRILENCVQSFDREICFELARAFNGLGLRSEAEPWMKTAAELGHPLADSRLKGWPK